MVQDKKKRWGVTGDYPEKSNEGEQRYRKISARGNCKTFSLKPERTKTMPDVIIILQHEREP